MRRIRLSAEAHEAIRNNSELKLMGEQQPDGTWIVPLTDETMKIINKRARPGENISNTIVRVLSRGETQ